MSGGLWGVEKEWAKKLTSQEIRTYKADVRYGLDLLADDCLFVINYCKLEALRKRLSIEDLKICLKNVNWDVTSAVDGDPVVMNLILPIDHKDNAAEIKKFCTRAEVLRAQGKKVLLNVEKGVDVETPLKKSYVPQRFVVVEKERRGRSLWGKIIAIIGSCSMYALIGFLCYSKWGQRK
jgi:hypothetical protein